MGHAAAKVATRHHHHQHSRHNWQRAGPVATCNISSKAAAAQAAPPISPLPSHPSPYSLYCRSVAVVVYFSLELSLECCQRKCAYVAAVPKLQQQQGQQSLQQRQRRHMWHATDASQAVSQPKVVAIFGNNSSSITLASVAWRSCLLWLPHNGDVFVFASAIS